MQDSKGDQPQGAPVIQIGDTLGHNAPLLAGSEQDDGCTKQHRENCTHLAFDQQIGQTPHNEIHPVKSARQRWIGHGLVRLGEADDIDAENTEKGEASDRINR